MLSSISSQNWSLIIGHYLGVDHIGHTFSSYEG